MKIQLPEVTVRKVNRNRTWAIFIDGNMHLYGYVDRVAATQAAQTVRAELACSYAAERLNQHLILNTFLRSN